MKAIPILFQFLFIIVGIKASGGPFTNIHLNSITNIYKLVINAFHAATVEYNIEIINKLNELITNSLLPQHQLIIMPITNQFNPPLFSDMHNKILYSDKCSLPSSFGRKILGSNAAYPWIFEISILHQKSKFNKLVSRVPKFKLISASTESSMDSSSTTSPLPLIYPIVDKTYCSVLNFNAPENFLYVPPWIMKSLNVTAGTVVSVRLLPLGIKPARRIVLQPYSVNSLSNSDDNDMPIIQSNRRRTMNQWLSIVSPSNDNDKMESHGNFSVSSAAVLLENQLNKYSSLTAGSTIELQSNDVTGNAIDMESGSNVCNVLVKAIVGDNGKKLNGALIQDADVQVDVDLSLCS
jgi:hypothetical protein